MGQHLAMWSRHGARAILARESRALDTQGTSPALATAPVMKQCCSVVGTTGGGFHTLQTESVVGLGLKSWT
jgi:hypothetical protein